MNDKIYNQIKDEFFAKLKEYLIGLLKINEKIEQETGLNPDDDAFDNAYNKLIDENAEYKKLQKKLSSLKFDIDRLLIDLKGYPLTVPSERWISLLDAVSDYLQENIDDKTINNRIDLELMLQMEQKDQLVNRVKDVKVLYLHSFLHDRVFNLYAEAVNCYIQGYFNATCVLCRAISELIAKRYIEHRGQGDLLCGKDGEQKTLTIPAILRTKLSCPIPIIEKYRKIHLKADHILHDIDEKTTQSDALETLNLLREFIIEFPKCT